MTVSVDSPMSEQSHVTDVIVMADGNPRPGVVTFHFSPMSGVAEANTRIRLGNTQNVIAVAGAPVVVVPGQLERLPLGP